jgi:hypothetical protein
MPILLVSLAERITSHGRCNIVKLGSRGLVYVLQVPGQSISQDDDKSQNGMNQNPKQLMICILSG